jgi:hypothetical protein
MARRLLELALIALGVAGWILALRERERADEIAAVASERVASIRRDVAAASFTHGDPDA